MRKNLSRKLVQSHLLVFLPQPFPDPEPVLESEDPARPVVFSLLAALTKSYFEEKKKEI